MMQIKTKAKGVSPFMEKAILKQAEKQYFDSLNIKRTIRREESFLKGLEMLSLMVRRRTLAIEFACGMWQDVIDIWTPYLTKHLKIKLKELGIEEEVMKNFAN